MRETSTNVAAIEPTDEEFVAVPVDPKDRQRFTPIDATATRLAPGAERHTRMLLAVVAASAAIVAAFLAGYLVGDRGAPTDVPVRPVAQAGQVTGAAPGQAGSAPGRDAGMFATGARDDAGADGAQDPRRG